MAKDHIHNNKPTVLHQILRGIVMTFGGLTAIVLVLVVIIPLFLSLVFGRDIPMPDDRALLLSKTDVPREENAYFDLLRLSAVSDGGITEAEIEMEVPKGTDDLKYLESYGWDSAKVEELLDLNQAALEAYDAAASKPQFQYDITADPADIDSAMPIVALNSWRRIARISLIKAIYLMKQGQEDAAFAEAMKSVRLGDNIERSRNMTLITYLVGLAMKKAGLDTIQTLAGYAQSPDILERYQKELENYPETDNGDPFRLEYMHIKTVIESPDTGLDNKLEKLILSNSFYYKPNKTLKKFVDFYSGIIEKNELPCSDRTTVSMAPPPGPIWKLYFTENAMGESLFSYSGIAMNNVSEKKCENQVMLDAARITLAIRQYYLANGSYPESLDELSPEYIDELPNDPYSGGPFILDTEAMTLSSVIAEERGHVYDYGFSGDTE